MQMCFFAISATLLCSICVGAQDEAVWPVLKTYDQAHQACIRMPMGGIGTGTISLSGTGGLVDWEIFNNPNQGFVPYRDSVSPAFVIRTKDDTGNVTARLLEGPLDPSRYEGSFGCMAPNHGFPRFRSCLFKAAYPLAQVALADEAVPVRVTLEAMNPLVPQDADLSGLPVVLMRWRVTNTSKQKQSVTLATAMPNPVEDHVAPEVVVTNGLTGLLFSSLKRAAPDARRGTFFVGVPASMGKVTTGARIRQPGWSDALDQFWRRLVAQGDVGDTLTASGALATNGNVCAFGTLASSFELAPNESRAIPFVLAWHYPHRGPWGKAFEPGVEDVGNYYCTRYSSSLNAAFALMDALPRLERQTLAFVQGVLALSAPDVVKEAALFNLSTLRSTTCFRTADGHFWGWEGVGARTGSCMGNCTHVWGYEHALVDLWPTLAKDMCEVEFGPAMDARGHMSFRIGQPVLKCARVTNACADGQMQCIIKAYECWQKTKDDVWLAKMWPNIRKALSFAWIAGGWDADQDGVMEGCQHNTMDVEYYGPNPQMAFLYLAALRACERMATACGQADFAARCQALGKKGSAWVEANLFNGEWYEHKVVPPKGPVAAGLRHGSMGARDVSNPDYQLAAGCLVDQLLGDYAARAVGLGPVADYAHARKATDTILARNRRMPNSADFNHMRDFVLAGERSLKMAWYPPDRKPKTPFPYYNETMTGFEYVVAAWLAQTGDLAAAEKVVRDIRNRYDGLKRNPFDEAECGSHYARALASWTVLRAYAAQGTRHAACYAPLAWGLVPMPRKCLPKPGVYRVACDAKGTLNEVQCMQALARIGTDAAIPPAGYRLSITPQGIAIASSTPAGTFYAVQTLRQLAEIPTRAPRQDKVLTFPCVEIEDAPAYRYRGLMIDEARHFLGKEVVKKEIDLMARHKLNVLHWHLVDDQGWRIEIKKHPELVTYGSVRPQSVILGGRPRWDKPGLEGIRYDMNGEKYGPFYYTQADIREIVAYAKARFVQIVPEIELPGHVRALLAARPDLGCRGEKLARTPRVLWSIEPDVLCAGNDAVLGYLEDIFDEVCALFPSDIIHIGGDECPKIRWNECPKCQARLKALGFTDARNLQAWFTKHFVDYLSAKGRRTMGWDEVLHGDVPKSVIGMSWRTSARGGAGGDFVSANDALAKGFDLVMTPQKNCYYSYPQALAEDPYPYYSAGSGISLEQAYAYDPARGVPPPLRKHILGGQACVWGEMIYNVFDFEWKTWPRACAMAEILWTAPVTQDFGSFKSRMESHRRRLIANHVNCAPLE